MPETPIGNSEVTDHAEPASARTDEQLMVAFASGKVEAFDELFSRYKQPVFGFFRRRLSEPSQAQADELTQETFLAVLRASSRYQPSALFRTWLYAIGFKILRAHRRKTAFRATFLGTSDRDPAIENSILADVMIRQAMGKLDRLEREILMLREFEQLGYAEIAELLNLPVNTVRSRLFRARMALRESLSASAPALSPKTLQQFEERI
jgi:RNA polymerase sigma factor (sigma-70 family)